MEPALRLAVRFAENHPDRAARRLEGLGAFQVVSFLDHLDPAIVARLLEEMLPAIAASCIEVMEQERRLEILALMPLEHSVAMLRHVSRSDRGQILKDLSAGLADRIERALRYPAGSAGAIAEISVLPLPADLSVGEALAIGPDLRVPYLYVVDRDQKLVGVVHRRAVEKAPPSSTLAAIMTREVHRIPAGAQLGAVLQDPSWRDLDALPVVDGAGVYVGAIRHKSLRGLADAPAGHEVGRSPLATLLELGELYWVGLDSVVNALATGAGSSEDVEGRHGT